MCMIAYRPAGSGNIPNAVIDTALVRHGDGFGVAYREGGALVTERFAPSQRKAFRKVLKRIDRSGGEYVAHFRWATHGPRDAHHAHPFEYEDAEAGRVLVFHNGVIDIATRPSESDTEVFVRDVLAHLPSRWWRNPAFVYLVNAAIDWSKLVIMTAEETVNLHDGRGSWDGGLWYSSNHKPTPKYVPSATTATSTGTSTDKASTSTALAPYKPSAIRSAVALGLVETAAPTCQRDVDRPVQFRHGGHNLTAIKDISLAFDADYEDAVICDTCFTIGTVYVIDGTHYIDMGHRTADDSEDAEDLLPGLFAGRA